MKYANPNDPRVIFARGAVWQLHSHNPPSIVSLDMLDAIEKQADKLFPDGKLPNHNGCPDCGHHHQDPGKRGKTCGAIQHLTPKEGTCPWATCPCVEGQGWE